MEPGGRGTEPRSLEKSFQGNDPREKGSQEKSLPKEDREKAFQGEETACVKALGAEGIWLQLFSLLLLTLCKMLLSEPQFPLTCRMRIVAPCFPGFQATSGELKGYEGTGAGTAPQCPSGNLQAASWLLASSHPRHWRLLSVLVVPPHTSNEAKSATHHAPRSV